MKTEKAQQSTVDHQSDPTIFVFAFSDISSHLSDIQNARPLLTAKQWEGAQPLWEEIGGHCGDDAGLSRSDAEPDRLHHSMVSSARVNSQGGIARGSAFAALRLITNSHFCGDTTGSSSGLAPFRMRPA
jgi:hypothetical protein